MTVIAEVDWEKVGEDFNIELCTLVTSCARMLMKRYRAAHWWGYYVKHWEEKYAGLQNHCRLFTLRLSDNLLIGCVVLSDKMPKYYGAAEEEIMRNHSGSVTAQYISMLAIHPEYQGRGHAKALLSHAEKAALDMGTAVTRLDTRKSIQPIVNLYLSRGYKEIGIIMDEERGKPVEYGLYEKDLRIPGDLF